MTRQVCLAASAEFFEHDRGIAVRGARGTAVRRDGECATAGSQRVGVEEPHPVVAEPDEQPFAVVDVGNRKDLFAIHSSALRPFSGLGVEDGDEAREVSDGEMPAVGVPGPPPKVRQEGSRP